MSISFNEAKKIIKDDIKKIYLEDEEDEEDFNWISKLIYGSGCGCGNYSGDSIPLLINVLKEWKLNPPSKEILDDLFININQLNDRYDHKAIKMTFLSTIGRMISDEPHIKEWGKRRSTHDSNDEQVLEVLKLLIYFGLDFGEEELKNFKTMVYEKVLGLAKFLEMFNVPIERKRKRNKSEP